MAARRARDINVPDLLRLTIKINSKTNGVKETTKEGKVMQKEETTGKIRVTEEHKDATQTRVASRGRTPTTIKMQVGKALTRGGDLKTTVITTKASIAGVTRGTDATTGDISEDMSQQGLFNWLRLINLLFDT